MLTRFARYGKFAAAILLLIPVLAAAAGPTAPPESVMWPKLRAYLFQDRAISDDASKLIELIAPDRAQDAAVMPVVIKAKLPQTPERYIKTIHLILDDNPGPVAAVFHLTPASGRADIETRVRVEQYTYLRAVVETNDGSLSMVTKYVKASGGCSAPAGRDSTEAARDLGKMRLSVAETPMLNEPVMAQLMIRHPNHSGLVMDQLTRLHQPPHYVRRVEVAYAGEPVMSADMDISISENPNFRFYFIPAAAGDLTARASDSEELEFATSIGIAPG